MRSKQININQHAYRPNHSTTTAICQISDNLYEATDQNLISVLLAVDQSSAFDTVDHCFLLEKLRKCSCSPNAIKWFTNYLNFRTQYVSIGGKAVIPSVSSLGDKYHIHDKIDQKACILSHIGLKCRPGLQLCEDQAGPGQDPCGHNKKVQDIHMRYLDCIRLKYIILLFRQRIALT